MAEASADVKQRYIGVDIGATNIRAGVVDDAGRILGEARRPALAENGLRAAVDRAIEAIREAVQQAGLSLADIRAIGAGVPGAHRSREGICVYSPNFADSRGVPVLAPIRHDLDLPAFMLNDVAVQTIGEHRFGAGQGYSQMVMITLGTGIGGGAIIDGEPQIGPTEGFAEVGHMTIEANGPLCGCGNRGCWEALAGRDAIVRRAVEKIQTGRSTAIADMVDYRLGSITPALIARSAEEGDNVAAEVLAETAHYLGIGIANLIQLYNPQILVIGGGIAQAGPKLFEPLMRTVRSRAHMVPASTCRVVRSRLAGDAGVIGAAVLAMRQLERIPPQPSSTAAPEFSARESRSDP